MYKRDFDNLLAGDKLPKSILLYGNCTYLNDLYCDKILDSLNASKEEITRLYFDEYSFQTAKNFLSQSSLFGDRNILVIKSEKSISKKDIDKLVDLCFKNDSSYLIYQFYGEDSKAKNISKSFSPKVNANFVRFFKPNHGEAVALLHQKAQELNLNINGYALSYLYQNENEELSLAVNDLKKLVILDKEIKKEDIDEQIYGLGSIAIDEFMNDLLNKKDIKEIYPKFMEFGSVDEIRVINAIESYITMLFTFYSYIKINGKFDPKEILGYPLPPQIANERSRLCMKFSIDTYDKMLKLLLKSELKLKTMQDLDKNAYLLSRLIKLQSLL